MLDGWRGGFTLYTKSAPKKPSFENQVSFCRTEINAFSNIVPEFIPHSPLCCATISATNCKLEQGFPRNVYSNLDQTVSKVIKDEK
jgi:hypothetical protein